VDAAPRKHGAPKTCYVISADEALDGQKMPHSDALHTVAASYFGTFISCILGKLGYVEYEDMKSAYLLQK
jgi:hypothetical protein